MEKYQKGLYFKELYKYNKLETAIKIRVLDCKYLLGNFQQ